MTPDAPRALPADACPDPEQLAAYLDGGLPPDERTVVERHLVECADCRDIVAGAAAAAPAPAVAVVTKPSRVKWYAVGGGLLAAAAAVLVVVAYLRSPAGFDREMTGLASALNAQRYRPVEGRLTGAFAHLEAPNVVRGATAAPTDPRVSAAAAALEQRIGAPGTARDHAALAQAYLATGRIDAAVRALENASRLDPASAASRSDLAAALLQRGTITGSPVDFESARAAAEQAIAIESSNAAARFNLAVALERLGRPGDAAAAWRAFLAVEPNGAWADEARKRAGL